MSQYADLKAQIARLQAQGQMKQGALKLTMWSPTSAKRSLNTV